MYFYKNDNSFTNFFHKNGFVIIKKIIKKKKLENLISEIKIILKNKTKSKLNDIDKLFDLYIKKNSPTDLFKIIKNSSGFLNIISQEEILNVIKKLINSNSISIFHDISQFRIDGKQTQNIFFPWHQDFPYNVTSENAVTLWSPLFDVSKNMGTLIVKPKSHQNILKVKAKKLNEKSNGKTFGKYEFQLTNKIANIENFQFKNFIAGDVLLFHSFLVHKSGKNHTSKYRWVINSRYSCSIDKKLMDRKWTTVSDKKFDIFKDFYPKKLFY